MSAPRYEMVRLTEPGYYHCISRCVRRSFLCGQDRWTGRSFDHRKQWIEDRLIELAGIFAISVHANAIMSNHCHVVAYVDPERTSDWTDDEVAQRWMRLYPVRENGEIDSEATQLRTAAIAVDPKRVALYRGRLGNLSWFMRNLNQPMACMANREDDCTGHFWESRFKCQALLDQAAVMSCMVYVDLNPIRAGVADGLPTSTHTSIHRRLRGDIPAGALLLPVAGPETGDRLGLDLKQYVALVDWSGRQRAAGKRGMIIGPSPAILGQLGLSAQQWAMQVSGIETRYWRAVGDVLSLVAKAREIGLCWLKGVGVLAQLQRRRWPDLGAIDLPQH